MAGPKVSFIRRFHCTRHVPSLTGKPAGSLRSTNCRSLWKCLYGATTSSISSSLQGYQLGKVSTRSQTKWVRHHQHRKQLADLLFELNGTVFSLKGEPHHEKTHQVECTETYHTNGSLEVFSVHLQVHLPTQARSPKIQINTSSAHLLKHFSLLHS